ncbi:hypothetical protein MNBD_GAMMA23-1566 [hydrothermal vent metagenome]|uniref:Cytochrome c domain-containing protein n=1 Tax=hydrothermal vent metagenome TaxID=652676 RepID=A0A3B0ZP54_9ZZZZ
MKDSQFVNYLIGIVGALFAFLILMVILAKFMTAEDAPQDVMVSDAVNARIQAVGAVTVGAPVEVKTAAVSPADSYQASCFACHGTGAAGAPVLGDKAVWKARIAQGKSTLYKHAIVGFKGMPPKGGSSLSDSAMKAVVDYMIVKSK